MAVISDLSGGRNGVQSPVSSTFPPDQSVEAINVDYRNGGLGRKRGGSYDVLANTTGQVVSNKYVASLIRHVTTDETLGQVWAFTNITGASEVNFLPAGTVWSQPGASVFLLSPTTSISGVSFNGKLFIFYNRG